jgi:hypothetical protein
MRKLLFLGILIVSTASMTFAQSTDDYHKWEFYGGYSHNRVDTGIGDSDPGLSDIINEREGFNGFDTAVTGNITRYVGLKVDFAGHFKNKSFPLSPPSSARVNVDSSLYNILGGVQLKDNSTETRFKPFAQALVGLARGRNKVEFIDVVCIAVVPSPCSNFTETDTGFAGAFGAGLDIRAGSRFDIRAIQIDYNPTRLFDSTQHNFRIGAGIVIH